jgi:hypothetical protein
MINENVYVENEFVAQFLPIPFIKIAACDKLHTSYVVDDTFLEHFAPFLCCRWVITESSIMGMYGKQEGQQQQQQQQQQQPFSR